MAATPPGAKKRKLDYMVDQNAFDEFMKACSKKGFAPQVILEQAMRKFTQTGQVWLTSLFFYYTHLNSMILANLYGIW